MDEQIDDRCGVCGDRLVPADPGHTCKTCEHFFHKVEFETCVSCQRKYTAPTTRFKNLFWRRDAAYDLVPPLKPRDLSGWFERCTSCRRKILETPEYAQIEGPLLTVKDYLATALRARRVTRHYLYMFGIPDQFIDYCLGEGKPPQG